MKTTITLDKELLNLIDGNKSEFVRDAIRAKLNSDKKSKRELEGLREVTTHKKLLLKDIYKVEKLELKNKYIVDLENVDVELETIRQSLEFLNLDRLMGEDNETNTN